MGRSRQGGSKHKQIMKAAIKVFAKKGFYNTRVSEIARKANVADGTIYLYFKNKDDILIHLFEEEMEDILQSVRQEIGPFDDPLDKLGAFVRKHLRMVEENRHLAEVIQVELRQSNKFMKDYSNQKFREYLNVLAEIVVEGQGRGLIRNDIHPSIAKHVIFGALDEMSTFWIFSKKKSYTVDEAARQVSAILINGVLHPDLSKTSEALHQKHKEDRHVREEGQLPG